MFMPELNPILSYLSFARVQLAQFITVGGAALAGNGAGRLPARERGGALPAADRDHRRALACSAARTRPVWERANSYIAPNAYDRAMPLGAIEAFDCKPLGRRAAQRDGRRRDRRAAVLRGAAAPLGQSEVPAPETRKGAVRGGSEGPRGHLSGYSLNGFRAPRRGTRTSCSSVSREIAIPATVTTIAARLPRPSGRSPRRRSRVVRRQRRRHWRGHKSRDDARRSRPPAGRVRRPQLGRRVLRLARGGRRRGHPACDPQRGRHGVRAQREREHVRREGER